MNEGFGVVGEVGNAVADVASGDVPPGGRGEDSTEDLLAGATGGGSPSREIASSTSRLKASQSALRKLVKVRWGGSGKSIEKALPSWMKMGRWSELRVVIVNHSESIAM